MAGTAATCTPEERALLDQLGGLEGIRRQLWEAAVRESALASAVRDAARTLAARDAAAAAYESAWDALREVTGERWPAGFVFERLREVPADAVAQPAPLTTGPAPVYDRAPDAPATYSADAPVPDLKRLASRSGASDPTKAEKMRRMGQ